MASVLSCFLMDTEREGSLITSCVDGILVNGASRLINVDTGDSVVSTALGAATTGTRETTMVGGLSIHRTWVRTNDPNHLYLVEYKVVEEYGLERVLNWLLQESLIEPRVLNRIVQKP
ncbi:hypothetical protein Tco_0815012 [Tanacetum coccineum]